MKNIHNLKHILPVRKSLRNNSTSAEAELWKYLSNKKLSGRKFRRQHSVGNFIIDFYCHSEKLGIELDGEQHLCQSGIEKDRIKEEFLSGESIKILRFENRWVFEDIDYVLKRIFEEFEM
jgi:very-short-patch-repair endonuclease